MLGLFFFPYGICLEGARMQCLNFELGPICLIWVLVNTALPHSTASEMFFPAYNMNANKRG